MLVPQSSLFVSRPRSCSRSILLAIKITIPAVKIPDAPSLPLLPETDEIVLPPEVVLSTTTPAVKLERIDSSLFPSQEEPKLPSLLPGENEDDFGEFLLDAVQWL
jgi:hypothetical protein